MVKKGSKLKTQRRFAKISARRDGKKEGKHKLGKARNGPGAELQSAVAPPDLTAQKKRMATQLSKMQQRQSMQRSRVLESRRAGVVAPLGFGGATMPRGSGSGTGSVDVAGIAGAVGNAAARSAAYEERMHGSAREAEAKSGQHHEHDNSRRAYMKELRKVVENADVILEVLDARDPMGCRCADIEDAIAANPSKKLVLIINKIDLVPHEVLEGWVRYLRREHPTLPFKASTQQGGSNLAAAPQMSKTAPQSFGSKAMGTDQLMSLLKNYTRGGIDEAGKSSSKLKMGIAVGIIGYPNVGKSSIINSLKRTRAVGVSSTAGFTKCMQEVVLDRKIRLLDCPGIVFDDNDSASVILRNCINAEALADPVPAVEAMLRHCDKQHLMTFYDIPDFEDVIKFLGHMARKRGKLGKGGITDRNASARAVLGDWNNGKIPFWTDPPVTALAASRQTGAEIVTSLAAGFDPMAGETEPVVLNPGQIEAQAAVTLDAARAAARAAGRDEDDLDMELGAEEGSAALTRTVNARAEDRRRGAQARADADAEADRDFEEAMAPGAGARYHDAHEAESSAAQQPVQYAYEAGAEFDDMEEDPYLNGAARKVQSKKALAKKRRKEKARALMRAAGGGNGGGFASGSGGAGANYDYGLDSDPDL